MIARRVLLPLAVGLLSLSISGSAASEPTAPSHPKAKDSYTITSVIELVKPFRLEDMIDDFQDAQLVSQNEKSATFEITYYPLFTPAIGENQNWRKAYAGMTEYLRPTPSENWDEAMRADLLAELKSAGIEPDTLTDKQLVEQVSRWAMRRSKSTRAFSIWTFHYEDGKPVVLPDLRAAFERERAKVGGKTEQEMINEEVLGRSMFYSKTRGSCTSSAIYLTTIYRALGIPTRVVFCIPPFDANDSKQGEMFYEKIQHHRVRESVREALEGGGGGFANHLFTEVYVGNRWVRLNYDKLGQPILDKGFFGLLTHIYTSSDLSREPLAETWGRRYFTRNNDQAKLSSVNPYRLISVSDRFGENAPVDNELVPPPPELTTVTIVDLLTFDSPDMPKSVGGSWPVGQRKPDFMISFREWVNRSYVQMRLFYRQAGKEFVLSSPGQPDLHARLTGSSHSKGDGSFQGFFVDVVEGDRAKIAPGAAYTIQPQNISEKYRWQVPADLKAVTLKPKVADVTAR
jgi:hypothetical protein